MQTFTTKVASVVFINGDGISLPSLRRLANTHSLFLELRPYSSEAIQRCKKLEKSIFVVELCENLSICKRRLRSVALIGAFEK